MAPPRPPAEPSWLLPREPSPVHVLTRTRSDHRVWSQVYFAGMLAQRPLVRGELLVGMRRLPGVSPYPSDPNAPLPIEEPCLGQRPVTLVVDPLVPVVVGRGRNLLRDRTQPRVFPGRLVEVGMHDEGDVARWALRIVHTARPASPSAEAYTASYSLTRRGQEKS